MSQYLINKLRKETKSCNSRLMENLSETLKLHRTRTNPEPPLEYFMRIEMWSMLPTRNLRQPIRFYTEKAQ